MPRPRIKLAPTGTVFDTDFNVPTGDMSTLGGQLAFALRDREISHVFMPNKITVKNHPSIVGGRDLGANDAWYNEAVGLGPTITTMNGQQVWNFTKSRQEALRLRRPDTTVSWSVVGGIEITTANLALTGASGPRSIFIKFDTVASKYNALQLVDTGDDLLDYWTFVQGSNPATLPSSPPAAGRYVFCASYNSVDRSARLYVNSATTALISITEPTVANVAVTGRWSVGGDPGAAYNWEGPIGYLVFMPAELHGSAALDAIRLAAMQALANPTYGYNVTLT